MKKNYFTIGLLLLSSVASAQIEKGDTTAINEVIIEENRFQIPFTKRNRNIQIISKEEIAQLPVKSINELLSFVSGVDVRQRGQFGGQADISIDGGSFEQALILLNGAKVSDPQTAHHSMNLPIPLDAVERIEILRGPMARVYGVNALTGAVNIVTKTADRSNLSVRVEAGSSFLDNEEKAGVYHGNEAQIVGNIQTNNISQLIGFSRAKYNGQRYNTAGEHIKGYYQNDVHINSNNSIQLFGGYIYNEFGANGFYASPGDKESFEIVKTAFASISTKHQLSENFYVSPRITNRFNKDDYRYYRNDLTKARSQHENNVLSLEFNSRLMTKVGDFGLGVELRDEDLKSTNMGNHLRENFGSYLEYRTDLIPNISLNIGTYLNYNTQYGWKLFPGIDIGYNFLSDWKLMFNVGKSQRIPSFTDLYLKQPSNVGNSNLTSESAFQYEGSLEGSIASIHINARYFNRQITDYIDWIRNDISSPYMPYNFGDNKMQGMSIAINQDIRLGANQYLGYTVSYAHLIPKKTEYDAGVFSKYVLESLKHQAIARVNYKLHAFEMQLVNRFVQRELNKSYNIVDARVGYAMKHTKVYFDATNLFNASYAEFGSVPIVGKWFLVGLRVDI